MPPNLLLTIRTIHPRPFNVCPCPWQSFLSVPWSKWHLSTRSSYSEGWQLKQFWCRFESTHKSNFVILEEKVNSQRYIHNIINPPSSLIRKIWSLCKTSPSLSFKNIQERLREAGIQIMEWPISSPDLIPIKCVWDLLKRTPYGQKILVLAFWISGWQSRNN